MVLVEIRCGAHGCGRLLGTIGEAAPPAPTGHLDIPVCPRHGGIRPRGFLPWARSRIARGESAPLQMTRALRIDLAGLQPAITRARATGRTEVETVVWRSGMQ